MLLVVLRGRGHGTGRRRPAEARFDHRLVKLVESQALDMPPAESKYRPATARARRSAALREGGRGCGPVGAGRQLAKADPPHRVVGRRMPLRTGAWAMSRGSPVT